jgi:hypothetical protein
MNWRLVFLVSFISLLGLVSRSFAQCSCPEGVDPVIITDTVVCEEGFDISGCTFIVESTGTLIANGESTKDGGQLIINGGSVIVNDRFDMGEGYSSYLEINDWGTATVTGTFKFPDDSGGEHRILINCGILHAGDIQLIGDRDAEMEMGCGWGSPALILDEVDEGDECYDPQQWYNDGFLHCVGSGPIYPCIDEPFIDYVDGGAEVHCEQWPGILGPDDGATLPGRLCHLARRTWHG